MKTYLITGAAGFIGSHLVEKLYAEGNTIIALDNFNDFYDYKIKCGNVIESIKLKDFKLTDNKESTIQHLVEQSKNPRFSLHCIDIRNITQLKNLFEQYKIDTIIHLAALAGVRPSIDNPLDYTQVNITGTVNLWEMANKHNIKRFINASSSSVYGNNTKIPFEETDIVDNPISPYASTKRATEILGYVYHHLYAINMIHLRFFTVYGPRQRPDLAIHKFAKLIFEQKEIPFYGNGKTSRDYTYIDDIITGIINSIDYLEHNNNVYEIINLGENEVINLLEMVSVLEKEIGIKAKINHLPMQPGDVLKTNADISKAKKLINYQPETSFSNGIKKFINWLKINNL